MIPLLLLGLALAPASTARAAASPASRIQALVGQTLDLPPDADLPPAPPEPGGTSGPADDAHITTQCEKLQTPIPWSYCISRDKDNPSEDVLYYLHGLAHDENDWRWGRDGIAIRQTWEAKGKPLPISVAISFGPFWLLSEKNSSARSGLLDVLVNDVIPFIEKERLGGVPRKRLLIGESMGGFNATELVLTHPELFERAAIVCPAIVNVSPYADADEIARYIQRTGADPQHVRDAISLSQSVFPDEASWETAAPLVIGKTLLDEDFPPLHVSCGDKDQYGFFEGAKAFADLARDNGVDAVWEPLSGGHCTADPAALADFLIP
jgi:pimeloyl-ACP methyl ester carboxylesterase